MSLGGMAANPCWLEPRMVRCRVVDVECDQFGDPQPGEQQHADDGPVPDPAGGRGCRGHRRRSSRRCSRGGYRAHLEAAPLAAHTRRTYAGRVAGYLAWLAELDPLTRRRQGDPFTDGHARDYTVRDYRTHLLTAAGPSPPRSTSPWPPATTSTASSGSAPPTPAANSRPGAGRRPDTPAAARRRTHRSFGGDRFSRGDGRHVRGRYLPRAALLGTVLGCGAGSQHGELCGTAKAQSCPRRSPRGLTGQRRWGCRRMRSAAAVAAGVVGGAGEPRRQGRRASSTQDNPVAARAADSVGHPEPSSSQPSWPARRSVGSWILTCQLPGLISRA